MGAVSDTLALGGIALLLAGMIAQAIAGASIRSRPTLAALGLILVLTGFFLPRSLADEPWRIALQFFMTAAVLYLAAVSLWRLFRQSKQSKPSRDAHA